MPTITCTLCRKSFEAGPDHCPHCHLRLPGAAPARRPPAAPRRRPPAGRDRADTPRVTRRPAPATSQCPACAHPITRDDQWCKWCKWPVNRKT